MFDPIRSQSIQRWEYEGGRILARRNGTDHDQDRWIPSQIKANPVKRELSLQSVKGSPRSINGGKPNWIETINNLEFMKRKLLVVDDDQAVRRSLTKLLEMQDFEVL